MLKLLKKYSISLTALFLIVLLLLIPTGYEDAAIYKETDRVKAQVLLTEESAVYSSGLIQTGEQYCKVKIHYDE